MVPNNRFLQLIGSLLELWIAFILSQSPGSSSPAQDPSWLSDCLSVRFSSSHPLCTLLRFWNNSEAFASTGNSWLKWKTHLSYLVLKHRKQNDTYVGMDFSVDLSIWAQYRKIILLRDFLKPNLLCRWINNY